MQLFEVIELTEFPFMGTEEIVDGVIVSDIITENINGKVFIFVDHDTKRIWTYNSPKSPILTQIFGGILAGMFRQQLKLFYRVFPLNLYSQKDSEFQDLMEKQLGPGRAKVIETKDFSKPLPDKYVMNSSVGNPQMKKAIDYVNQIPQPEKLTRRFMIVGGNIYIDEEITESFLKGEINVIKPVKLGQLNDGFTFFRDHNYSTRLIIKDRKIQGIELYIKEEDKSPPLELKIPITLEEKYNKPGSIDKLIKSFQIPNQLPLDTNEESTPKDDTPNQS